MIIREDLRLPLTQSEVELISLLASAGAPVSQERLLQEALGYRPGIRTRALPNAILRLRKKLEIDPGSPRHLLNVPGLGYRLEGLRAAPQPLVDTTDRFFSREHERAALLESSARIVSLTGPGGIGKTRLARQLSATQPSILFIPLAGIDTVFGVLRTIAMALHLEIRALDESALTEHLGEVLKREFQRVVLDNIEQLLPDVLPLVQSLSATIPVVVTSRERLHLHGEQVIPLAPLTNPYALEMFLHRARLQGTALEPQAVRALLPMMEGVPLAIEMGAAWAAMLGVRGLQEHLTSSLQLESLRRDRPERQRTIAASIDWSWSLLDTDQQRLWIALSLHPGGVSLATATALFGISALRQLQSLWSRSLLSRADTPNGPRWSLLPSMREFGLQRLSEGIEQESIALSCDRHYVAMARSLEPSSADPDTLDRLTAEHDNLQAAFRRTRQEQPTYALWLLLALGVLLEHSGQHAQLTGQLLALLDRPDIPDELWCRVSYRLGCLERTDEQLQAAYDRLASVRERTTDTQLKIACMIEMTEALHWMGHRPQAAELANQSQELLESCSAPAWLCSRVALEQGITSRLQGHPAEAIAHMARARAIYETIPEVDRNPADDALLLFEQAAMYIDNNNNAQGLPLLLQAAATAAQIRSPWLSARIGILLAGVTANDGDYPAAIARLETLIPELQRVRWRNRLMMVMNLLGSFYMITGRLDVAAAWLQRSEQVPGPLGLLQRAGRFYYQGILRLLEGRPEVALAALQGAREAITSLGRRELLVMISGWLALAQAACGQPASLPLSELRAQASPPTRDLLDFVQALLSEPAALPRARATVQTRIDSAFIFTTDARLLLLYGDALSDPQSGALDTSET